MKIADYVIEEMKKDNFDRVKNMMWIGEHEILKSAYQNYIKDYPDRKKAPTPGAEIKYAWNAVVRDKRFNRTGSYIKSSLFSVIEHKHYVYELIK